MENKNSKSYENFTNGYTKVPTKHLTDKNLSNKEKGLLTFMLSFPSEWYFSVRWIAKYTGEKESCIGRQLKTLIKADYIRREKTSVSKQKYGNYNYALYPTFSESTSDENCKKTKKTIIAPNLYVRCKELSFRARGLLSIILTFPDKHCFTFNEFMSLSTDGRRAINLTLKELEDKCFIKREVVREKGRVKGFVCTTLFNGKGGKGTGSQKRHTVTEHIKNAVDAVATMIDETGEQANSAKEAIESFGKENLKKIALKLLQLIDSFDNTETVEQLSTNETAEKEENVPENTDEVKKQIDYNRLCKEYGNAAANCVIACMSEVYSATKNGTVRIGCNRVSAQTVKNAYASLTYNHISHALEKIIKANKTTPIRNIKSYMLVTLYNESFTNINETEDYTVDEYGRKINKYGEVMSYGATYDISEYELETGWNEEW